MEVTLNISAGMLTLFLAALLGTKICLISNVHPVLVGLLPPASKAQLKWPDDLGAVISLFTRHTQTERTFENVQELSTSFK